MTGVLGQDRGVALLMVMWIFMILTVLAGEFSRSMRDDAVSTSNLAEEVQARNVAIAGINQAVYRSMRARAEPDPVAAGLDRGDEPEQWLPDGAWHKQSYAGGSYEVRLVDEGGKVSLNRADQAVLRQIFVNAGVDADEADAIVDAILDWRDSDDLKRVHGAESDYYLGLREPYRAKNAPFDSIEELLLVRGITPEMMNGTREQGFGDDDKAPIPLREVFSVFNRSANINVRTAPPAVLRALLGGEVEDVEEIVQARDEDPDGALSLIRARAGDPTLARRFVDRQATTLAIDARAMMDRGHVQARVGTIVDVGEDGDGFHIVRWFDRLPAL